MSKKKPSADDLHTAAQWLDVYEGAEDAEACQRVRAWLLDQADAAEFRDACREAGVPVAQARKAFRLAQKRG
jgi:flagellar motor protein MotB